MPSFSCTVEQPITIGLRLDRYIAEHIKILSRSQIKARNLEARLNGKKVKVSRILKGGEFLELFWNSSESPFLIPEDLPLEVIYEDERVIVVNKTQGMVVHPGAGNSRGTLANALLYRRLRKIESGITGETVAETGQRPGIVHRLDKDTSGVIIAAWDDDALDFLSAQFKARKVRKSYAALVRGCPKDKMGIIDKRIVRSSHDRKTFTVSDLKGRPSLTYYKLVRSYGDYSLLLLRPKTGRTHQLRVHLKYLGLPILGDPIYGKSDPRFPNSTLMLHAKRLSLYIPTGRYIARQPNDCPYILPPSTRPEGTYTTFRTQLPQRFKGITQGLSSDK